jgi:hypothetical protein
MNTTIDWLMGGDPAIRWQVMRDLLDAPESAWQAERQRTLNEGWGARYLARQDPDGRWGGGIYSPKWISTTYTLLTLYQIGIPSEHTGARLGAKLVIDHMLGETCDAQFLKNLKQLDRCIVGMILQLGLYFGIEDDRIAAIVANLMNEIMPDGAWNCRKGRDKDVQHSSFHTTFNVLDGLREYIERGYPAQREAVLAAEHSALEFMLQHQLYKSHRTGEEIHPSFSLLSFPCHWYYDVLRGLEYFARARAPRDPRMQDAVDLLLQKRSEDGRWKIELLHSNKVFFNMETRKGPSHWNTLRALRVQKWWEGKWSLA